MFLIESFVYGIFVCGYLWALNRLLGEWLHRLFAAQRVGYAGVALLLVVAQGLLLEQLTHRLVRWILPPRSAAKKRHL